MKHLITKSSLLVAGLLLATHATAEAQNPHCKKLMRVEQSRCIVSDSPATDCEAKAKVAAKHCDAELSRKPVPVLAAKKDGTQPSLNARYATQFFPEAQALPTDWHDRLLKQAYLQELPYFEHILDKLALTPLPAYADREQVMLAFKAQVDKANVLDIWVHNNLLIITYQLKADQPKLALANVFNCFVYQIDTGKTGMLLMARS